MYERIHRYAGWVAVAVLWALVILAESWCPLDRTYHAHLLLHRPELWMTLVITLVIAAPWLCIRRVAV